MSKLKKCPFCGGEGELHRCRLDNIGMEAFTVICKNCGATGPIRSIGLRLLPPRMKNDDPILKSVYESWNNRIEV